jgi:hypothetical protein
LAGARHQLTITAMARGKISPLNELKKMSLGRIHLLGDSPGAGCHPTNGALTTAVWKCIMF